MAGRFEQFHLDFKILRAAKNLRKIFYWYCDHLHICPHTCKKNGGKLRQKLPEYIHLYTSCMKHNVICPENDNKGRIK